MAQGTFVPMDAPSMVQDSVSSINRIPGRSILLGVILVVNSVWLLGKAIMIVGWGNDNGSDAVTGTSPHPCPSDLGKIPQNYPPTIKDRTSATTTSMERNNTSDTCGVPDVVEVDDR
ncbi:hypothetical protein AA0113_g7369 [Alternaria arborescens]|uniref:Uncharacterized protein n=1 Tax=Alternaria arborescens TaxID=156630 RepID=A0A4Q4RRZ3_9PLEO|nr:hypothetical protein AA0111_g9640 [Alternaria arborescens]RYO21735.1 hypothetical protein AA0111_g9640 [Alternaria arborescens]RYO59923.1 hypothetical protein AA0113_g7369 [Alternaria arborescens]